MAEIHRQLMLFGTGELRRAASALQDPRERRRELDRIAAASAALGEPAEDDLVLEKDGARVLIDPVSLPFLADAEIDFADELIGACFVVRNPNATSSCGCGTSFSICDLRETADRG